MEVFDVSIKELNNNLDYIRYEIVIDNQKIISGWYKFSNLLTYYINGKGHYGRVFNKDIHKLKKIAEIILNINNISSIFITKEGCEILKYRIKEMYTRI